MEPLEDSTLLFINMYREQPCLYNTALYTYKNKDIMTKAYLDISKTCDMTVAQVKAKIKSLRTAYTRQLWYLREYNEKKAAGIEVKPPNWRYFHDLDFLRPHCSSRRLTFSEVCGHQVADAISRSATTWFGQVDPETSNDGIDSQVSPLDEEEEEVSAPGEMDAILEFSPNVQRRWRAVADSHSLTTSTDTAQFLLEFYERTTAKVDSRCTLCHRPLTLYCMVCAQPVADTLTDGGIFPPHEPDTDGRDCSATQTQRCHSAAQTESEGGDDRRQRAAKETTVGKEVLATQGQERRQGERGFSALYQ